MESLQERIAKRAYELFLARGGQHGYHIQDWARAEKEIKEEQPKPVQNKEQAPKQEKKPVQKVAKEEEKAVEAAEVKMPKRTQRTTSASPVKKKATKKKEG